MVLMVIAATSWGSGVVLTKVTLEQLAPLDVLGIELFVGTVVLWTAVAIWGRGGGSMGRWRAYAVLGVIDPGLSFALGDFGLQRTNATDGALLIASESLFAVALARPLLGERLGSRAGAAIALGFAGSVLLGLGATGGAGARTLVGDLLVLGGTAAAAAYSVGARRIASAVDPEGLAVTATQMLAALLVSVPVLALGVAGGHSHVGSADAAHLLAGLATGVFSTAIPFVLFNVAIRDVEIAGAALISNVVPLIGVTLAVVLLGETLSSLEAVGGAAVLVAALGARSAY
jgi:drug/metabolite transporter (DMT)-like permease